MEGGQSATDGKNHLSEGPSEDLGSSGRFVRHVVKSGLLTSEQIGKCQETLAPEEQQDDEALARALVRAGLLTRWQTEKIWKGKTSGFIVGQYKILGQLGAGGMGKVYRAEHTFMGRQVALKILPPKQLENRQAAARFLREVRASARLKHPNIVTVHDAGQLGKIVYMSMELVEGQNLDEYVEEHGPMSPAVSAGIIAQAAGGLQYAHDAGLIHRDIKPQNLMLSTSGQVKILDLGVVRFSDADAGDVGSSPLFAGESMLTADGILCGTLPYIAPEQIRDPRSIDGRCDIYALGCSFYFLLTGQHAFQEKSSYRAMELKLTSTPTPVTKLRADIPDEIVAIVDKMMAKEPTDRFQTPTEIVQALTPYRQEYQAPQQRPLTNEDGMAWLKGTRAAAEDKEDQLAWLAQPEESGPTATPPIVMPTEFDVGRQQHRAGITAESTDQPGQTVVADPSPGPQRLWKGLWGTSAPVRWSLITLTVLLMAFVILIISAHRRPDRQLTKTVPANRHAAPSQARSPAAVLVTEQGPTELTNSLGMKFVRIEPGELIMGQTENRKAAMPDEMPAHRVIISRPYYLSIFEVTQIEYEAVTGEAPSQHEGHSHPVERVSFEDAQRFCRQLSALDLERGHRYRLPTEAEWEYAARAGTATRWCFSGRVIRWFAYGWAADNSWSQTHPVGEKSPNAWGLYDMYGNVGEWCCDWYADDYYRSAPLRDPTGPQAGSKRVVRGGSYCSSIPQCSSVARDAFDPAQGVPHIGFRIVCELVRPPVPVLPE